VSERLPYGWVQCEMGTIAKIVGGGTPKTSDESNFSDDNGFPWLTPVDLSGYHEMYISHGKRYLSDKGLQQSAATLMPAGTILYTSRAPIGYVVIAENEIATNQGFKSFILKKGIHNKYIYFYLKSSKEMAESLASGTTFLELSGKRAATIPVGIPPLAEQKRIAEKLDSLLAKVDACKTRLDKVSEIIKRFRQSVLADAVSGKLTEDWRNENRDFKNARKLMDKVEAAKEKEFKKQTQIWEDQCENAKKKGEKKPVKPKKTKPLKPLSAEEHNELPQLPDGWCWVKNESFVFEVKDGTHDTPKYHSSGIPFITQKNIREIGFDFNDKKFISIGDHNKFYKRSNVEKGDILISMIGHNRGMSCIVDIDDIFSIKNVGLIKLFSNFQSNKYLLYYYQSKLGRDIILKKSKGGAQPFIGLTELRNWPVPMCPIAEQIEITRRVEALFAIADPFDEKLSVAKKRMDKLTASILSKAFRGELVPQDPNDEPANWLLKSIRTEREAWGAGKKKSKRTKKKAISRGQKIKYEKVEADDDHEPASQKQTVSIEKNPQESKHTKQSTKIDNRFDPYDALNAFRKSIFRQNEIKLVPLLKLVSRRLGIIRLTKPIREELEPYINTTIRRKIITREGEGFIAGAPTIEYYEDAFLIKVLCSVTKKGWEYPRDDLVGDAAKYLGFGKPSDAFKDRLKSVFRKAVREGILYRSGSYVGKS